MSTLRFVNFFDSALDGGICLDNEEKLTNREGGEGNDQYNRRQMAAPPPPPTYIVGIFMSPRKEKKLKFKVKKIIVNVLDQCC